jgi:hypothetical protein
MFQLAVLDAQLPVKQAFKLMHEEVCVLLCLQDFLSGTHFFSFLVIVCSHVNGALVECYITEKDVLAALI